MIPAQFAGIPPVLRTILRNLSKIRIFKTMPRLESGNIQNLGKNTNIEREAYSKPNKHP